MIHELREYHVAPGKGQALHRRFQEVTLPLFKRHGIHVVGFWEVLIGESPKLVYLCQYDSLAHRERAWSAFQGDPDWLKAKEESERDGALTTRIVATILKPTPYSPLR